MDKLITWNEFEQVDIVVGTIVQVDLFPEAKKPAYIIRADFGDQYGVRKTSAQVTDLYQPEELLNKQILGVLNFPKKQIGPMTSEFLLTGIPDENGHIVISTLERKVPNGNKLC